jgi:hypothetical protein
MKRNITDHCTAATYYVNAVASAAPGLAYTAKNPRSHT